MVGSLNQLAAVAALSLSVAACATGPANYYDGYSASVNGGRIVRLSKPVQCVPYARDRSGIRIWGDAYTWWQQAAGRYSRNDQPSAGAVLVIDHYAGPRRAHLAVVRSVVSAREIRVDHANWLDDGNIYLDDPVIDVSAANDWSEVRVFNLQADDWGAHVYDVRGFIDPAGSSAQVAEDD